jgi:hypothetical protein
VQRPCDAVSMTERIDRRNAAFSIEVVGTEPRRSHGAHTWLTHTLSGASRVSLIIGLVGSIILVTWAVGGPNQGDANLSMYTTWLLAHGDLACAYPAGLSSVNDYVSSVLTSPLYPLIAAALVVILRIGAAVPFPATSTMGHGCSHAATVLANWAGRSGAREPTLWIGVATWIALVLVLCWYLSSDGPITRFRAIGLAVSTLGAPAYQALIIYFHPQDLLAVALIVAALGSARRERWLLAGVLIGLGLLAQQFVILAAIPVLITCPRPRLPRFCAGAVLGLVPIGVSLLALTSGSALFPIILGSDRVDPGVGLPVTSSGGSVLWELHLHGLIAFLTIRGLPIVSSTVASIWARRRWDLTSRPDSLVALVGLSLSFRLVFEQNIFSYYFTAVFVLLVLVAATMKSRVSLVVLWIAVDLAGFNPIRRTNQFWFLRLTPSYDRITAWSVVAALVGLIILHLRERRIILYQPLALIVVVAMAHASLWGRNPALATVPHWFLQVLLVPFAIALFLDAARRTRRAATAEVAHPMNA